MPPRSAGVGAAPVAGRARAFPPEAPRLQGNTAFAMCELRTRSPQTLRWTPNTDSPLPSFLIWRLRQYWELNGVKLNSSSRTWNFTGVSSNPSTATFYANPQFAMIAQGSPTAPTYGEYSVTLKVNSTGNYIACQGRAQIGM